jgi:hypothetical protein
MVLLLAALLIPFILCLIDNGVGMMRFVEETLPNLRPEQALCMIMVMAALFSPFLPEKKG